MRSPILSVVILVASPLGAVIRAQTVSAVNQTRPRAREMGIHPGVYDPGPKNSITDVAGVLVGQVVTIANSGNVRRSYRHGAAPREPFSG